MRNHFRPLAVAAAMAMAVAVSLAACGSSGPGSAGTSPHKTPSSCHPAIPMRKPSAKVSGTLRVLAAASLTEPFTELGKRFQRAHPGTTVQFTFGPSSGLVTQLDNGAPADVLATADTLTMAMATKAGSVQKPSVFTCNRLAIITAKGNPKRVKGLSDLGHRGVSFVLCAAQVPCGNFAAQALAKAHNHSAPEGREKDVKSVVAKVELGEADAGIVYRSDVDAAASKTSGVAIPPGQNVVAAYPMAVAKSSSNVSAARAFVDYVRSPAGQRALARHGFSRS